MIFLETNHTLNLLISTDDPEDPFKIILIEEE